MKTFITNQLNILKATFPDAPTFKISFRLRSERKLGHCAYRNREYTLSFNMNILNLSSEKNVLEVVLHEYAHLLSFHRYGFKIAGHGKEWVQTAKEIGLKKPKATTDSFQNEIIAAYKQYIGACSCSLHTLSKKVFLKIQMKESKFICSCCGKKIKISEKKIEKIKLSLKN